VCFNQGINARLLNDETATALASVRYYNDDFRFRRIYTAWDSRKDESRLFDGLNALVHHGVKPGEILVYMLIGHWPGKHTTTGSTAAGACGNSGLFRFQCRTPERASWWAFSAG
jgi:hypothetical protein